MKIIVPTGVVTAKEKLSQIEWNTDMSIDADFVLDKDAQKLADEAAKSSVCIPIGEGENCW